MSFSVNDCRANAGGLVGKGCVGELHSPGTSDCGTGRSSIGHRGLPVSRSNTYRNPNVVGCATTSTFLPSCFTVSSLGAVEIVAGGSERDEHDGALLLDGRLIPVVHAAIGLPGLRGPGILAKLAR